MAQSEKDRASIQGDISDAAGEDVAGEMGPMLGGGAPGDATGGMGGCLRNKAACRPRAECLRVAAAAPPGGGGMGPPPGGGGMGPPRWRRTASASGREGRTSEENRATLDRRQSRSGADPRA